jgi:hypothetical protein
MAGFVQYQCVLYFNVPSNKGDINFVDSKETVRKELDDRTTFPSPFHLQIAFVKHAWSPDVGKQTVKRRSFKERFNM